MKEMCKLECVNYIGCKMDVDRLEKQVETLKDALLDAANKMTSNQLRDKYIKIAKGGNNANIKS